MITINLYSKSVDPWAAYDEARASRRQDELAARRSRRAQNVDGYRAAARTLNTKKADTINAQKRDWYQANIQKARGYRSKFKRSNRAKENAYRRAWIAEHPEARQRYWRNDYAKHRQAYEERARKWRRDNAEAVHRALVRYRERHNNAPGSSTDAQIEARVAFYGGICAYCGGKYEHLDHAIPLSRGGSNWPANLRPACEHCNLSKGAKTPTEFARYRSLLTVTKSCGTV